MTYDDFRARVPEGEAGSWKVERFHVSDHGSLLNMLGGGGFVPVGDYTRLLHGWQIVMSDTRDEYLTHYEFLQEARGRVLVNGLGLGCALGAILTKPEVEHVDVVERSPEVLALVGPTFAADPRVNLIEADAYEQSKVWPRGTRWDVAWHDIWDTICADDLEGHAVLLRSYGRRCGWQQAWRHSELVSLRRRGW